VLTLTDRCERVKRQIGRVGHLGRALQGCIFYRIFRSCLRSISDLRFSRFNVMSMMPSAIPAPDGLADGRAVVLRKPSTRHQPFVSVGTSARPLDP